MVSIAMGTAEGTAEGTTASVVTEGTTEAGIVSAALRCFARVGVSKTTLEEVAHEAGCARATVYRRFPGKDALARATVRSEGERITRAVTAATAPFDDPAEAVEEMLATATHELAAQAALRFVLVHEPERILPSLCFESGSRFLTAVRGVFAPTLARFLPAERVPRASEWCARTLLAHLCPEGAGAPMISDEQVRALARQFVVPGVVPDRVPTTVTTRG